MKVNTGGNMNNQQTSIELVFEAIKKQIQKQLDRDKRLGILDGDVKDIGSLAFTCTIHLKNSPQSEADVTIRAMKTGEDSHQVICYNWSKIPPTPNECSGWFMVF